MPTQPPPPDASKPPPEPTPGELARFRDALLTADHPSSHVISYALLKRFDACGEAERFRAIFGDEEVTLTPGLALTLAPIFDLEWVFTNLVKHDDRTYALRHQLDTLEEEHGAATNYGSALTRYDVALTRESEYRRAVAALVWQAVLLTGLHTLDCACDHCRSYFSS